jgi:hypothetical protein
MRWLMIALLVSLLALLIAAAGLARHIYLRSKLRRKSATPAGVSVYPADEADQEPEP